MPTCDNCRHHAVSLTDEPCATCDDEYNEHTSRADYDVYDQDGQYIGSIDMDGEDPQSMPQELEINGVVYYPQF